MQFFSPTKIHPAALVAFTLIASLAAVATPVPISPRAGFEQNRGQFPPFVLYGFRPGAYLTTDSLVLSPDQVKIRFGGNAPAERVLSSNPLPYVVNVYSGGNPQQWRTGIQRFGSVEYRNIYPGINLTFSVETFFTFRFVVAPGAPVSAIHLGYTGAGVSPSPYSGGSLQIWLKSGRIGQNSQAYQDTPAGRVPVAVAYRVLAENEYTFTLDAHDETRPVVIETTLPLSGAGSPAFPLLIARSGAMYAVSADAPIVTSSGPYDTAVEPVGEVCGIGTMSNTQVCKDVAVSKYSPAGDLLYVTYLRGARNDAPSAMVLDKNEAVYLTGSTDSLDFPVTSGASQRNYAGPPAKFLHTYPLGDVASDVFVAKLDGNAGTLVYSTYLGGPEPDSATSIHVDDAGNAFVAGPSNPGLPVTTGALQTAPCVQNPPPGSAAPSRLCQLGYVAKIGASGALSWLTHLPPAPTALTVDSRGNVYFGGSSSAQTGSTFIARLNQSGSALVYSKTYFAQGARDLDSIAVDSRENVWFSGPASPSVGTSWIDGYYRGFLTKIAAGGSQILYESPFIGGKLAMDANDNLSVYTQWYGSSIVRTPGGLLSSICAPVMISKFSPSGIVLLNRPVEVSTVLGFTSDANLMVSSHSQNGLVFDVIPITAAQTPDASCMVNSASLSAPGNVAPGEIVTILGRGLGPQRGVAAEFDENGRVPTSLGGVQVLFEGAPAPVLYAGESQINAIAPFTLAAGSTVHVEVHYLGGRTAPIPVTVTDTQTEFFTLDGSGAGPVLAFNQDATLNSPSSPAHLGSVITIFATGTGITAPASVEGVVATSIDARPVASPSVALGGPVPLETIYAGPSPGSLTSVTQLNVRLPSKLPASGSWPMSAWPIFVSNGNLTQIVTIALAP